MKRVQLHSNSNHASQKEDGPIIEQGIGLAIGNFDGIHLGHQKLLNNLVAYCRPRNLRPCALTFNPHPRFFFSGTNTPRLASDQTCDFLLENMGIEYLFVQEFDHVFAQLHPEDFIEKFLHRKLSTQVVCIGENFRFGVNRTGDPTYLRDHGKRFGMESIVVKSEFYEGKEMSSSRIRSSLDEGDLTTVNAMLGRSYSIEGKLNAGRQLGRTIDIPTLNIEALGQALPKTGVYSGYTTLSALSSNEPSSQPQRSVINIGYAPTVTSGELNPSIRIESHLIDTTRSYGQFPEIHRVEIDQTTKNLLSQPDKIKSVQISFGSRLRSEMKFQGVDELKNQIFKDIVLALRSL